MSRILYVWELGAGYGHIAPFQPIARQLKQQGHEVIFVLKNLEFADILLDKDEFNYLQAPMRWPSPQPMPPAFSYPGIMKNVGFTETNGLFARVHAWLSLYQYLQPDLILFDHAPTALLAAHGLGIPRALFGSGFCSPPLLSPMPSLRPWLRVNERDLINLESHVLETANSVLSRRRVKPLSILADLFEVEENFLCAFPELDHYTRPNTACYWGPTLYQTGGIDPQWPSIGNNKIFAYLNPDYPGLETVLQQLRSSPWCVLIHIPGTTPAFIQKHSGANVTISPLPLKLSAVCNQSDMAISYGSAGTLASFLLAGKPLLVLPFHLEQVLNGRNLEALGAGICIMLETKKPSYKTAIAEILSNHKYTQAAVDFAKKYADFCPEHQTLAIAARCVELTTPKTPACRDFDDG